VTKKDSFALKLGVVLGIVSSTLVIVSFYAAGLVFIFFSIALPLTVSLVAQERIITLSLVPNLLMTLICSLFFAVFYPSMLGRYGPAEIALGIVALIAMGLIPALAVSGLVKLIRRRR